MFPSPCNKPGEQIASDNATHVRTVTRYSRTVQEQNSFNPDQTDLQVFNIDDCCYLLIFCVHRKSCFAIRLKPYVSHVSGYPQPTYKFFEMRGAGQKELLQDGEVVAREIHHARGLTCRSICGLTMFGY